VRRHRLRADSAAPAPCAGAIGDSVSTPDAGACARLLRPRRHCGRIGRV